MFGSWGAALGWLLVTGVLYGAAMSLINGEAVTLEGVAAWAIGFWVVGLGVLVVLSLLKARADR
jgi:hypothetical protein